MGWDPFGSKAAKKIKQAAAAAAEAAKQKGEADAKAMRFNAAVLERNSETVEEQGLIDEARNRRQASRFLGEQEAAIASSGFDSYTGFGDIRESTEHELDLDAIIIRRQAQFKSADLDAQSELALMGAEQAILGGEAAARLAILQGNAQAQQAQSAAISGTIGLAVSAVGVYRSDARVKENVKPMGRLPTGDRLYAYNYIWEPNTRRIGVMAQEVRQRVPGAVSADSDGILCVDYAKLGLPKGYSLAAALNRGRR